MNHFISYGNFRCKELSPHKNRGVEITYISRGNLEWMVEGVSEPVIAGSVFFTLPWQVHGSMHPREPDNAIHHALFQLKNDYLEPCTSFMFPDAFGFTPEESQQLSHVLCSAPWHCYRATPAMRWLMPALIAELQGEYSHGETHAISLLRAILVELVRIIQGDAVDTDTQSYSEKRVQKLLSELAESCDQRWTLNKMAVQCKLQRTQFNAIVQKLTGCTPMDYLARLRMEHAKTLLRETDMKIIDIAFACGFSSSQYFANTFRHTTGLTPTGYRRHCNAPEDRDLMKWKKVGFRSETEEIKRVERFTQDA